MAPPISRQNALQRALNKILTRRVNLLKKQEDANTAVSKSIKDSNVAYKNLATNIQKVSEANEKSVRVQAKVNTEIKKTGSYVGAMTSEVKEFINKNKKELIETVTTIALAVKAHGDAVEASTKSTKIWLSTSQGIDDVSTSYKELLKRGRDYQNMQMLNAETAWEFGKTTEQITKINDKWIQSLRYTELNEKNTKSLQKLTKQTEMYATVLGEDAISLQEEATKRMFKFGESPEKALDNIVSLKYQVISLNKSLEDMYPNQAALFSDDFKKQVDAVSQGTRGYSQNLGVLSGAMSVAFEKAQRLGMTYDQAIDSTKAFGEFISGSSMNENARAMLGLDLMKEFEQNIDKAGKLRQEYLDSYDEETQKQLKLIALRKEQGQLDIFTAEQLEKATAQSTKGIETKLKLVQKLTGEGRRADVALIGLGSSKESAALVADMIAAGGTPEEIAAEIKKATSAATKGKENATDEQLRKLVLGKEGAVSQLAADAGLDQLAAPLGMEPGSLRSGQFGKLAAYSEKSEVTGALALAAAAKRVYTARNEGSTIANIAEEATGMDLNQDGTIGTPSDMGGPGSSQGPPIPGGSSQNIGPAVKAGMLAALSKYDEGGSIKTTGDGAGLPPQESIIGKLIDSSTTLQKTSMNIGSKIFGGTMAKSFAKQILGQGGKQVLKQGGKQVLKKSLLSPLGLTAGVVGSMFAAPAALSYYTLKSGSAPDSQLRKLHKARLEQGFTDPIMPGEYGAGITPEAWAQFSQILAEEPDSVLQGLVKDGILAPAAAGQVMALKKAKNPAGLIGTPPIPGSAPAVSAATSSSAAVGPAGSLGGSAFMAKVAGISPAGDITIKIIDGMSIPAEYDARKNNTY